RAGLVAGDNGFGIVESFDFQECGRTTGDVLGAGLAEHQTFAMEGFDSGEFRAKRVQTLAGLMRVLTGETGGAPGERVLDECQPDLESTSGRGCVEDEVANFLP